MNSEPANPTRDEGQAGRPTGPTIATDRGNRHRYFFVCGYQRSGTNWVGNLLNLHPRIHCYGEFHLNQAYYGLRNTIDPDWMRCHEGPYRTAAIEGFNNFVRGCLDCLALEKPGATWLGDRTPRELYPILPGCPHFLVVRDGRDVLVSWTFHQLANGVPEGEKWRTELAWHLERFREDASYFEQHPGELLSSEAWVRYVAHGWAWRVREDRKIVRLIESGELDARVMVLSYERLHAEPEAQRARMYRFLDLDPGEAAPLSSEPRTVPGYNEGSPGGFYRKGKVGDWSRFDRPGFQRVFMEEAGREFLESGYKPN